MKLGKRTAPTDIVTPSSETEASMPMSNGFAMNCTSGCSSGFWEKESGTERAEKGQRGEKK